MCHFKGCGRTALLFVLTFATVVHAQGDATGGQAAPLHDGTHQRQCDSVPWHSNYRAALEQAERERAMVLLWLFDPQRPQDIEQLERDVWEQCDVMAHLASCVPVKLSVDTLLGPPAANEDDSPSGRVKLDAQPKRLLDHPAFEEMLGLPGIALIDMRDPAASQYHHVVNVFPFVNGPISRRQLIAMFDLPAGSLTQRTLLWAVRTHAEHPQSASEEASALLMEEAASHAQYQASIGVQGHHQWNERFQRINDRLPSRLVAQEVCAESWPRQHLVEAAQECVHSWRQSSGHWDAVSSRHPLFGYDMKRGANGIWYATGIFGRKR